MKKNKKKKEKHASGVTASAQHKMRNYVLEAINTILSNLYSNNSPLVCG